MARFTALASDTSDDESFEQPARPVPLPISKHRANDAPHEDEDADISDSDSSRMDEDELTSKPLPQRKRRDKNALVEGEDGEFHHAHELDEDEGENDASSSSSSESSPRRTRRPGPTSVPWAQQVGVDPNRMHVMQASLFRVPEEEQALKHALPEKHGHLHLMMSNTLNRKHSRDSEGDGLRAVAQERASFAYDIETVPYRPSRKYARVESSASVVSGNDSSMVDAGLAFGRSFRVGWGPGATLVYSGQLCAPSSASTATANSSMLTKTRAQFSTFENDSSSMYSKLLSHHLTNTLITPDADGVPFANPASDLNFASFTSLFSSTDRSFEALLFRLGHTLFDDIDLHLRDNVTVDIREYTYAIRRKSALSSWLEEAVASSVDQDLKNNSSETPAGAAFSLLTGHQVEKACEAAMGSSNLKLATLISQAGGDAEFQEDLRAQLQIWREERIDVHIDDSVRKVYALLAGIVDVLEGSNGTGIEQCSDLSLTEGLDWKRVFGLHLWYAQPMHVPIAEVFRSYDQHWRDTPDRVAPPKPWYAENPSQGDTLWQLPEDANPPDALYSLLRLYADPACSLSKICSPFSFGPSPVDYSLPWHLYILFSRCMRIRDFADRDDPGSRRDETDESQNEDERVEGHSPSADLLASSYALQLEQAGLIQEAVFVLLHIEGSSGREKAIKDLLGRSAPNLDDWMTRGIVGSLKIPLSWVNEAKAMHALDSGEVYDAYQLYLQAGLYDTAHELAVLELAPEAVIRDDLTLLKTLFERIAGHAVDSWHVRGQAFLDYVDVRTRVPILQAEVSDPELAPDASQVAELDELTRKIPKLIKILPDAFHDRSNPQHNVALSVMIKGLMHELDSVQPLAISQVRSMPVNEATKLHHIHSAAYAGFLKTIQVA